MGLFGKKDQEEKPKDGCILATEIVADPSKIELIQGKYTIIHDSSHTNWTFDNLTRAINIMAESGWKCITITSMNNTKGFDSNMMYALMERNQ